MHGKRLRTREFYTLEKATHWEEYTLVEAKYRKKQE